MIEFRHRAAGTPARLGILPAAFHPPTNAHLALAQAALELMDDVLLVLPRQFPDKRYEHPGLEARLEMLRALAASHPRLSAGVSHGGLFIDIARECRQSYGAGTRLGFVCGFDAATRIVNWDYGEPDVIEPMLDEFELFVAERGEKYEPPPAIRPKVHPLPLDPLFQQISSSEVRFRIEHGQDWRGLVPDPLHGLVEKHYRLGER